MKGGKKMAANFKIETPRGTIKQIKHKNGSVSCRMSWNAGFGPKYEQVFNRKQAYIDSECIRRMAPLTPKRSGVLIKSATLGTTIGSGEIRQIAPYARRWYYEKADFHEAPDRGNKWFERMKNRHKDSILRGAQKIN